MRPGHKDMSNLFYGLWQYYVSVASAIYHLTTLQTLLDSELQVRPMK